MRNNNPRIYLFHCATCLDRTELMRHYPGHIREFKIIPMPCSGKLDILYLTKAFDTGAEGAAILICREGECRYMEGNMRAEKRAKSVDDLLEETGLGRGRIKVIQLDDEGIAGAARKLEDFRVTINAIARKERRA